MNSFVYTLVVIIICIPWSCLLIYLASFRELSNTLFRRNRFNPYYIEKKITTCLYDNIYIIIDQICTLLLKDEDHYKHNCVHISRYPSCTCIYLYSNECDEHFANVININDMHDLYVLSDNTQEKIRSKNYIINMINIFIYNISDINDDTLVDMISYLRCIILYDYEEETNCECRYYY